MEETEHWRLRLLELEEAQKAFGITLHKQMADLMGIEPSYYSRLRYEPGRKGRKNLGLDTLRAAIKAFGLRYDWFDLPLGSAIPRPNGAAPSATEKDQGSEVRLSIIAREPDSPRPEKPGALWPFKDLSYKRLNALLDSLDKTTRGEALRDIDSLLEAGLIRWEQKAEALRKRAS